jgi:hypothetical protein
MITGVMPQISMSLNRKVKTTLKEDFEEKTSVY